MSAFRPCVVIPTLNHVLVLGGIIRRLTVYGLPVYVLDDGSAPAQASRLREIVAAHPGAVLLRHEKTRGKGVAVEHLLRAAYEGGYTHALQVDADGQHDLDVVPAMLEATRDRPDALILGTPTYDDSIPFSRKIGRYITHFWVAFHIRSLRLLDSMCGFRFYPLGLTLRLLDAGIASDAMGFDTEIMVRLFWTGVSVVEIPVQVTYPAENHSNFRPWRDNLDISFMHTRLFFEGLLTRPERRVEARDVDWAQVRERGSDFWLSILVMMYRVLGRSFCRLVLYPVVFFFFITGRVAREASRDYLTRAFSQGLLARPPGWLTSYRHFYNFALSGLDKFAAWSGDVPVSKLRTEDRASFDEVVGNPKGALLLSAHVGNPELILALAQFNLDREVLVLMNTAHARRFGEMIQKASDQARLRVIEIDDIGIGTTMQLQEAIDEGAWVVLAADRAPANAAGRVVDVDFLGAKASFPQGPYILASLLGCRVYTVFCLRHGQQYSIDFKVFSDLIKLDRRDRERQIAIHAGHFATSIENILRRAPLQWYNFYGFWKVRKPVKREPHS